MYHSMTLSDTVDVGLTVTDYRALLPHPHFAPRSTLYENNLTTRVMYFMERRKLFCEK